MKLQYLFLCLVLSSCALQKSLPFETTSANLGVEQWTHTNSIVMEDTIISYVFQPKFYKKYEIPIPNGYIHYDPYVCHPIIEFYGRAYDEKCFYYQDADSVAVLYMSTNFDLLPEKIGNARILRKIKKNFVDGWSAINCEEHFAFVLAKTGARLEDNCLCGTPNIVGGSTTIKGIRRYWKDYRIYNLVIGYYNASRRQKDIFDKCIEKIVISN